MLKYLCLIFFLLFSCQTPPNRPIKTAFYYWKSTFQLSHSTVQKMEQLNGNCLYIRLFDIVWDEQLQMVKPIAPIQFLATIPTNFEVVPTIFITNQTLQHLTNKQLPILAKQLTNKVTTLLAKTNHPLANTKEIQIDCDWSTSTREKYFTLLTQLKKQFPKQVISATIRLHQVKYAKKTGIPPVKKGVLMCYNMGKLKDEQTENSILQTTLVKQYLVPYLSQYPLKLDVGLPIFSWGLLFRKNRFRKIINNLQKSDIQLHKHFKSIGNNKYQALQNTSFKQYHFLKNDIIRVEESELKTLQQTAQILSQQLPLQDSLQVILYHADATLLNRYTTQELSNIFTIFGAVE